MTFTIITEIYLQPNSLKMSLSYLHVSYSLLIILFCETTSKSSYQNSLFFLVRCTQIGLVSYNKYRNLLILKVVSLKDVNHIQPSYFTVQPLFFNHHQNNKTKEQKTLKNKGNAADIFFFFFQKHALQAVSLAIIFLDTSL